MKIQFWLATAALVAALPAAAVAQGPAAPATPRTAPGAGAAGGPADGKIAVIDTSVFIEKIQELRTRADSVNKKYEPRYKEMQAMQAQMKQLDGDIRSQAGVAAPDKIRTMQDQLQTLQTNYKRRGEDLQGEYNKELNTTLEPIQAKLTEFVKGYATKRNIVLILDLPNSAQAGTIAFLNPAIDVTDEFIAEYNKAYPVPGFTAAPVTPARPGGGR
ncbi:MAG: OmpH family outer membrane protein [Acidobacteria bacterium]|nr:OmpH family outer membrane protein [Acidobacteriota bacterium]